MFTILPKITEYLRIKPFQVMMPERLYEYKFHNDIEVMIKIGVEKDGLYKQAENDLRSTIILLEENNVRKSKTPGRQDHRTQHR